MTENPLPGDAEAQPSLSPTRSRRRRVLPTVVAALALGAAGAGVGYAAASTRQPAAGAADTGTTSEQPMVPSFHRYYGETYGELDPQSDGSTDTTGTASGS